MGVSQYRLSSSHDVLEHDGQPVAALYGQNEERTAVK